MSNTRSKQTKVSAEPAEPAASVPSKPVSSSKPSRTFQHHSRKAVDAAGGNHDDKNLSVPSDQDDNKDFDIYAMRRQVDAALSLSSKVLGNTPIVAKADLYFQSDHQIAEHELNAAVTKAIARVDELLGKDIEDSFRLTTYADYDQPEDPAPAAPTSLQKFDIRDASQLGRLLGRSTKNDRDHNERQLIMKGFDVYERALSQLHGQQQLQDQFECLLKDLQQKALQSEVSKQPAVSVAGSGSVDSGASARSMEQEEKKAQISNEKTTEGTEGQSSVDAGSAVALVGPVALEIEFDDKYDDLVSVTTNKKFSRRQHKPQLVSRRIVERQPDDAGFYEKNQEILDSISQVGKEKRLQVLENKSLKKFNSKVLAAASPTLQPGEP
jgi:hypothetical protein